MSAPAHPGSRWWKIDFHAHSPHSFDFGGLEERPSEVAVSVEDWILTYMRAGIDAIIIADHNTHTGIVEARSELVRLRDSGHADYRPLTIFPGVELTTEGGYHLIAMFDPSASEEAVNGVIHNAGYRGPRGASTETTSMSFHDVCKVITEAGGLAIPAHADGPMGVLSAEPRTLQQIKESGFVLAVELTKSQVLAEAAGWMPVLGSDAHHLDNSSCPPEREAKYPGSHFTWMKMQELNLNGVHLALADGKDSTLRSSDLSTDPNEVSHNRIERVIVRHGSEESDLTFSPWLNSLIGGRGVGKSTIVEVMRVCLGRYEELPNDLRDDLKWFSPTTQRPDDMRFWDTGTEVALHYRKLTRLYRITWSGSTPAESRIEVNVDGEWQPEQGSVADRFPVLIYSQKQIYETAKDTQSLLSIIDAQPEIRHAEWLEQSHLLKSRYSEKMQKIATNSTLVDSEPRLKGEIADVDAELGAIIALRDSDAARELDKLVAQESSDQHAEREAQLFEARLRDSFGEIEASLDNAATGREGWVPGERRHASEVAAVAGVRATISSLEGTRLDFEEAGYSPRQIRIEQLRMEIGQQAAESGSQATVESAETKFSQLSESRIALTKRIDEVERAKTASPALSGEADSILRDVLFHRKELSRRRKQYLESLELDKSTLQLDLFEMAEQSELEADLRELTHKATLFDLFFSGEDGARKILKSDAKNPAYLGELDQLKMLLKELRQLGPDAPTLARMGVTIDPRLLSHIGSLDATTFATDVDLWFPEDHLRVRYKPAGEENFRRLEQGSPGQKTATLLSVILRMSSDPLILDQPEDDLDNELITDLIVMTLKQIKKKRQVIVVTHNANVVVNADSENVSVLKHGSVPQVAHHGSIQVPAVRDAICRIMEGGEKAFESRYRRLVR